MNKTTLIEPESTFNFTIEVESLRLDKFLTQQFPTYSRTFLQELIKTAAITVNDKPVNKPSTMLKKGDAISITMPKAQSRPQIETSHDFRVSVLYTHEHFLIINKPAGLTVHESETSVSGEPTLVDWIRTHYAEISHVGVLDRPGIVHRLDKDTSGIMIIARTNYGQQVIGALFKDRKISKTYLAIVEGHPAQEGVIDLPIGRHPTLRHKMHAFKPHEKKANTPLREAETRFKVLQYFDNYALVQAKPVTGRTHQIRVHFAALGHPLIGDSVYGKKSALIKRHALHAYNIAFTFDGVPFAFTCSIPEDLTALISALK